MEAIERQEELDKEFETFQSTEISALAAELVATMYTELAETIEVPNADKVEVEGVAAATKDICLRVRTLVLLTYHGKLTIKEFTKRMSDIRDEYHEELKKCVK